MGPPTIFYFEIYNRICKIYLYKEVMVISKFRMKVLCTYIPATNPNPNPNPNPYWHLHGAKSGRASAYKRPIHNRGNS